jgi:hypothetical protein
MRPGRGTNGPRNRGLELFENAQRERRCVTPSEKKVAKSLFNACDLDGEEGQVSINISTPNFPAETKERSIRGETCAYQ